MIGWIIRQIERLRAAAAARELRRRARQRAEAVAESTPQEKGREA